MVLGITPVLTLMRVLIGGIGFCAIFYALDKPGKFNLRTAALYLSLDVIMMVIGIIWVSYFPQTYVFSIFPNYILCMLFLCPASDRDGWQVLYEISLSILLMTIANHLSLTVSIHLWKGNAWLDIVNRLVYTSVLVFFSYRFLRGLLLRLSGILRNRWILIALLATFGNSICFLYNGYPKQVVERGLYDNVFYLLLLLFLSGMNILILYTLTFVASYMEEIAQARLIEQDNAFLVRQIEAVNTRQNEIKRLAHDVRHHKRMVLEYLKSGKHEEALTYLEGAEKELSVSEQVFCLNVQLNSILSVYRERAEQEGIAFEVAARVPEKLFMGTMDLTALMGNILENAVNGCLRAEEESKRINGRIQIKNGKFLVLLENTCRRSLIVKEPERPGRADGSGIGVFSIEKTVEKYGGIVDFHAEGGIFSVRVVIPVP